jgi:hypothetical protein
MKKKTKLAVTHDPLPTRTSRHASGNWNPDWEPFAQIDPAWTEKAIAFADRARGRRRARQEDHRAHRDRT